MKRGDVKVNIQDESGNTINTVLKNALYIPSFPQDIFSVHSATEQGAEVRFRKDSSELVASDGTKFDLKKKGKWYFIDQVKDVNDGSGVSKRKDSLYTWHQIMRHCNKCI